MLGELSTMIEYRRLRSPEQHGSVLQDPPLSTAASLLEDNLQRPQPTLGFQYTSAAELASIGRAEIVRMAIEYTREYRDVNFDDRDHSRYVMSGHQPTLFHPGVWYKNFALSEIGKNLNAVAINLVVDNDICALPEILAPKLDTQRASYQSIRFDANGDSIPFESRTILDRELFESFPDRVTSAMKSIVEAPLVNQLWPLVMEQSHQNRSIGAAIARGRHRLEADYQLETAEIPISRVAQTRSFALFAEEVIKRLDEFRQVYNECRNVYRKTHRIRSNSHPVPALTTRNGYIEAPFWIWESTRPHRRSLFVKHKNGKCILSDGAEFHREFPGDRFVEAFLELPKSGVAIRPKALMTTMFSRVALCDLFLHGIGGSKYDQLTDAIMRQFWGIHPTRYMTMTATMHLPTNVELVTPQEISRLDVMLRELEFHPEHYVDQTNSAIEGIVREKKQWVQQTVPRSMRLARHQQISACNERLQTYVMPEVTRLTQQRAELVEQLRLNRIANSREYSFCLFPQSLADELLELAQ